MRCHSSDFVRFCIQSDCCSCCQNKQDGGRRISPLRRKSGWVFANFLLSTLENVRFQRYKLFLRIVFFTSLSDKIHKNTLHLSWTLDKTVCRKSVSFSVSMCFTAPFYIKASVRYALTLRWKPMTKLGMTHMQLLHIICRSGHRLQQRSSNIYLTQKVIIARVLGG